MGIEARIYNLAELKQQKMIDYQTGVVNLFLAAFDGMAQKEGTDAHDEGRELLGKACVLASKAGLDNDTMVDIAFKVRLEQKAARTSAETPPIRRLSLVPRR